MNIDHLYMDKINTTPYIKLVQKLIPMPEYERVYKQKLSTHPLFTKIYKKAHTHIEDIIQHIDISYIKNKKENIQTFINKHVNGSFISDRIKKDLQQSITHVDKIIITYKQHSLCFYNFCHKDTSKNIHYKQWTVMAIYALCIAELYNLTLDNLQVYVYPSTLQKLFPIQGDITCDNINSGYTTITGKNDRYIVLFRKEDVENVFIHECIHALGIDDGLHDRSDSFIKSFFTIQSSILLHEGYTEILTILYISICNSILLDIDVKDILYTELLYSLLQSNKIFSFYSISNSNDFSKWNDTTNSFGYIIIKTICLYHIDIFLDLFFDHTKIDATHFSFFIIQYFKSISTLFFNGIQTLSSIPELFLQQTLKKTIYDINW